ncbi:anti-sigma factor family protein [Modestobacter marinus]|uniref:anti-sigma factor family protein n=1 Tax=Modestobacter marinus TaxID=477641 RepID=UPI001C95D8D5|nr:zf-HC2 domain-containing protein [Modestobacter marinus]
MTGGPDPFEREDAAYVLGALGDEDRIEFEDHLRTCIRCAAAVAELAPLAGLLARLPGPPGPATAPEPPPDTLLAGLLRAVRRDRVRRRAWVAAAGVAAAAALVAGTVVVTEQLRPPSAAAPTGPAPTEAAPTEAAPTAPAPSTEPAGVPVALVGAPDVPVDGDLRLEDVAWGTRITIVCRYDGPAAAPEEPGGVLQLVVYPAGNGNPQSVARWLTLPGRDARVTGATDLDPNQIAEVRLLDGAGTVLLQGQP